MLRYAYAQFVLLRVTQLAQIDALEDRTDRWRKVLDLRRRAQQVLLRRVRSQSAIRDGEVLEGVPVDLREVRLKLVSIAVMSEYDVKTHLELRVGVIIVLLVRLQCRRVEGVDERLRLCLALGDAVRGRRRRGRRVSGSDRGHGGFYVSARREDQERFRRREIHPSPGKCPYKRSALQ